MPSSRGAPDPGIETASLTSLALGGGFFTTSTTWEALDTVYVANWNGIFLKSNRTNTDCSLVSGIPKRFFFLLERLEFIVSSKYLSRAYCGSGSVVNPGH